MPTALEVQHLTVTFGPRVVLHDLSFAVPVGSALAVIGPNGAGKTVLFKALIGMLPYEGNIRWARATRIGYVPQKLDLERDLPLTGLEFLRAMAAVVKVAPDAIPRLLERVGLTEAVARQLIGAFSGGQFQRLLLASAFLRNPTTLLLDEATAGIDEVGQERMYELLAQVVAQEKKTVLIISHELSVVYQHAHYVLCLAHGRNWFGPPREILTPALLTELYGSSAHHLHDPARA